MARKGQNSIVTKSPYFDVIMKKYEEIGMHLSSTAFHRDYISKIEPGISLRTWQNYVRNLNKKVQIKVDKLIDRIANQKVETTKMEDTSLRKILAIADVTLDEVVENPKILATIPVSRRMQWLFNAMKARDSRMTTLTKVQQEKRKSSMYDDMLEGAQYGGIEPEEASDAMKPKIEPKRAIYSPVVADLPISEPRQEAKEGKTGEIIEFSPNDL